MFLETTKWKILGAPRTTHGNVGASTELMNKFKILQNFLVQLERESCTKYRAQFLPSQRRNHKRIAMGLASFSVVFICFLMQPTQEFFYNVKLWRRSTFSKRLEQNLIQIRNAIHSIDTLTLQLTLSKYIYDRRYY